MKYVEVYDLARDEVYQCPINDVTAAKLLQLDYTYRAVRDVPRPDVPIRSRYESERDLPPDQWTL
jgi:hypothetical protein